MTDVDDLPAGAAQPTHRIAMPQCRPEPDAPLTAFAIIVAAGSGSRAGGGLPKQFRPLAGRAVLAWTIDAFLAHPAIDRVIAVINPDHGELIDGLGLPGDVICVPGGKNRTESVRAGLAAISGSAPDFVLIHDGARPLASPALISRVIDALARHDGAIPVLPLSDALLQQADDGSLVPRGRTGLFRAQTPQGFRFAKLRDAYRQLDEGAEHADDAAVALAAGLDLMQVAGEEANMKVTWSEDFARAEQALLSAAWPAGGTGFDVHRLEPGEAMMLCGVRIEAGLALVGHSDADVALHAITDAVLGCCGQGDIGQHFPPSDPQWKGQASSAFLTHALTLAREAGVILTGIDLTIICERPKIGPYREAMRTELARLTGLPAERVNIKATTTEGLGFTGRGEGIAAQALVTALRRRP